MGSYPVHPRHIFTVMKHAVSTVCLTLLALLGFSGCNTVDSVQPGKGVSFTVTGRTYDQVWKASVVVFTRQLTIVEDDRERGFIRAEAKAGVMTSGEVVGVFITPAAPGAPSYKVEIVSLKRDKLQFTGQDWTRTIITGIKAELGI